MSVDLPTACFMTRSPVATDPVKATTCTSGWPVMASPMPEPRPVRKLSTPAGRPASWKQRNHSYSMSVVDVAASATTVLPVMSAGALWPAALPRGKFQG